MRGFAIELGEAIGASQMALNLPLECVHAPDASLPMDRSELTI